MIVYRYLCLYCTDWSMPTLACHRWSADLSRLRFCLAYRRAEPRGCPDEIALCTINTQTICTVRCVVRTSYCPPAVTKFLAAQHPGPSSKGRVPEASGWLHLSLEACCVGRWAETYSRATGGEEKSGVSSREARQRDMGEALQRRLGRPELRQITSLKGGT